MGTYETWQEQLDSLARCEVQPWLLATELQYDDELLVHVVLLDPRDAVPNGYATSGPLFTRRFPTPDASVDLTASVDRIRAETMSAFAERFRVLLNDLDRREGGNHSDQS